ncbi:MAG: N-formylglutamate amidohydrolase [Rhizobiaceae bacterium]
MNTLQFSGQNFVPVELFEGDFSHGLILICDHARNCLPEEYGRLGLEPDQFERHIAYDIGARDLTIGLAKRLGVPAVLSTFSRLLIDPNRGEDDPTVIMGLSDGAVVPGNYPMDQIERQKRLDLYYRPYHQAIETAIGRAMESGVVPAIFSIHSFTNMWRGMFRKWDVALLWDSDPRFSHPLLDKLRRSGDLVVGENEPYDGALRNDTMFRHCVVHGLAHTLIEIRQDLIQEKSGVQEWIDRLAPMLEQINKLEELHVIRHFGSRTGPVETEKISIPQATESLTTVSGEK